MSRYLLESLSLPCGVALALSVASGCTELKDGSAPSPGDAFSLTNNGSGPDAGFTSEGTAFQCSASEQAPDDDPPERVIHRMFIGDTTTTTAPDSLRVVACALIDVNCENPVTPPVGPDDERAITLELPYDFDGFFEITSDETVPALYFLPQGIREDTFASPLGLISPSALDALAALNGITLDMNKGLLLVRTYDCDDQPAAGVSLESNREGEIFMFVGGLPIIGAEETRADGIGGYINVPRGLVRIEGTHVASGRAAGAASLVVREQWMTYGDLHPSRP